MNVVPGSNADESKRDGGLRADHGRCRPDRETELLPGEVEGAAPRDTRSAGLYGSMSSLSLLSWNICPLPVSASRVPPYGFQLIERTVASSGRLDNTLLE